MQSKSAFTQERTSGLKKNTQTIYTNGSTRKQDRDPYIFKKTWWSIADYIWFIFNFGSVLHQKISWLMLESDLESNIKSKNNSVPGDRHHFRGDFAINSVPWDRFPRRLRDRFCDLGSYIKIKKTPWSNLCLGIDIISKKTSRSVLCLGIGHHFQEDFVIDSVPSDRTS